MDHSCVDVTTVSETFMMMMMHFARRHEVHSTNTHFLDNAG